MVDTTTILGINDRKSKVVEIAGWTYKDGNGNTQTVKVLAKSMSMRLRAAIIDNCDVDMKTGMPKFSKFFPEILASCVYKVEQPNVKQFSAVKVKKPDGTQASEIDDIMEMDADNVQVIINAVMELTGFGGNAVDEARKNLSPTPIGGQSSN